MKSRLPLLILCLVSTPLLAERADRDTPIQLEAQRITIDDGKKIQILEGDVVLIKGTLMIQSQKIVVTEDQYGFQKGTAFGGKDGLARFRQKREGKDEFIEGQAERIEYDTRNEVAELFHRSWIRSGDDQVKGDYIWYDSINEKYLVTAGDSRDPAAAPPRVRAVIQPKVKNPPPEQPPVRASGSLELKGAGGLSRNPDGE